MSPNFKQGPGGNGPPQSEALASQDEIAGREPVDPPAIATKLRDLAALEESFFRDLKAALR